MRDAYRDDLTAAELRVRDLEREHTALVAQNATLEAALVRRWRTPSLPIATEPRRIAPSTAGMTDEEANQARLAAALQREADEKAARERVERDDAELRALAKDK